ncbi:acetyl-CoA carboxylase biotin carboxyl carrier protein [Nonomuraea fuscirosea]|uniref:Biotin carboxyl carrier protein of acetyl-CoA carboxylase n=1 Tax=Nonomuraea fuscirosea TaxID=1291556 RepID=A0A2T0MXF4_9ACTN|nr:biotin/lipoyl-containing protein [Nonomuraea fuscirosea]PRX63777.1 acetyl-CoA carboxylase biotin carboxyl carrier protein [Nonomuraea fuscirosea]
MNDAENLAHQLVTLLRQLPETPTRIRVQQGSNSLEVEWPDTATGPARPAPATEALDAPDDGAERMECVRAPMIGTFYRAAKPGAPPFVEEGAEVVAGQQVGVIESMKLMTPIETKCSGIVRRILVPDATSVEYDHPLIEIAMEG